LAAVASEKRKGQEKTSGALSFLSPCLDHRGSVMSSFYFKGIT
jgi:hypothetical protein